MSKIVLSDLMFFLESNYPLIDAMSWDNVGLQIGSPEKKVQKILTTLDVTPRVVDYANDNNFDTIISHHPLFFHSLKSFDLSIPRNQMIKKIIKFDINVYSMHTNFDVGLNGMNDLLANIVNLSNVSGICPVKTNNGEKMIGRMGNTSLNIEEIVDLFKEKLQLKTIKYLNSGRSIQKVGIVGGAGAEFIENAFESGVDLFITGDIKYHDFLDAQISQYSLVDIGHVAEKVFAPKIANLISENFDLYIKSISYRDMEIPEMEEK